MLQRDPGEAGKRVSWETRGFLSHEFLRDFLNIRIGIVRRNLLLMQETLVTFFCLSVRREMTVGAAGQSVSWHKNVRTTG